MFGCLFCFLFYYYLPVIHVIMLNTTTSFGKDTHQMGLFLASFPGFSFTKQKIAWQR